MSEWRQTLGRAGVCGTQGYYVEATAWTGLSQALSPVEMSQYMCFPKGRKASAFAGDGWGPFHGSLKWEDAVPWLVAEYAHWPWGPRH